MGRPGIDRDVVPLIRRMWEANPTWGSLRIRAEVVKLGLQVAISTVRKYRPAGRRPTNQTWKAFLRNHACGIAAMDFFVVPTATFRLLYVLRIVRHERRMVVHWNITESPTTAWTAQQVVEAFPFDSAPSYLGRDRDSIYGGNFVKRVNELGIQEKVISPRSPWQNPIAKRLIGSIRRECLDRVILINERHLRRLMVEYFDYYHRSRTHRSLGQDAPMEREIDLPEQGRVVEFPMVGGLHHQYRRQAA
ncbi:MAG: transposase [Verrucomicrobiales bacterium]|nr:transposase [Verrucomicrobiales bacterium]